MLREQGFTLSEVLIALLIIGVIAALTISSLMSNINQKSNVKAWRKIYSELMNAQQSMIYDNGSVEDSFDVVSNDAQGGINFQTGWLNYLNYIKKCDSGLNISQKCWYSTIKYYDGSGNWGGASSASASSTILKDGTLLLFYAGVGGDLSTDSWVFVDVNGFKGPNTFGKDVFTIRYDTTKKRFAAYGSGTTCSGVGFIDCPSYYLLNDG